MHYKRVETAPELLREVNTELQHERLRNTTEFLGDFVVVVVDKSTLLRVQVLHLSPTKLLSQVTSDTSIRVITALILWTARI